MDLGDLKFPPVNLILIISAFGSILELAVAGSIALAVMMVLSQLDPDYQSQCLLIHVGACYLMLMLVSFESDTICKAGGQSLHNQSSRG